MRSRVAPLALTAAVACAAPLLGVLLAQSVAARVVNPAASASQQLSDWVAVAIMGAGAVAATWYAVTAWALLALALLRRPRSAMAGVVARLGAPALRRVALTVAAGSLGTGMALGASAAPTPPPTSLDSGAPAPRTSLEADELGWGAPNTDDDVPDDGDQHIDEAAASNSDADRVPDEDGADETAVRVVVEHGDTLWDLTAEQYGPGLTDPEIAELWPQVFTENRDAVGANPHLIYPGQVLVFDPPVSASTSDGTTS